MKRLFIAIKIPVHPQIGSLVSSLKNTLVNENIKWVTLDNMHVTLRFLGSTEEYYIPTLTLLLHQVAAQCNTFNIELKRTGFFGKKGNPRVIWIGIEPNQSLILLKKTIDTKLIELGFEPDKKYAPHLTLGRIKQLNNKNLFEKTIKGFNEIIFGDFQISGFILYESILKSSGPEYVKIAEFVLND